MNAVLKPGSHVVIGPEFAKLLDYEPLVGAMGIIDDVLNALCGVTVLTGRKEYIGKQVDIHLKDCILEVEKVVEKAPFYALVNMKNGQIFYSNSMDLIDSTALIIGFRNVHIMRGVEQAHEALDFAMENEFLKYKQPYYDGDGIYQTKTPHDYTMHNLDEDGDPVAQPFRDLYKAELKARQSNADIFVKGLKAKHIVAKSAESSLSNLVDEFKKQLGEQKKLDTGSSSKDNNIPPNPWW